MILYVNGDSHSVGAELLLPSHNGVLKELNENTNQYCPIPNSTQDLHVECIKRSYSQLLANLLGAELVCEAESGGSNSRILRVTRNYLRDNRPDLLVIGWSPFERDEWWYNGVAYQISGGGIDSVPKPLADKYKQWVIDQSNPVALNSRALKLHQDIFDFHQELLESKVPHIFFNTFNSFQFIPDMGGTAVDWDHYYIEPYLESHTYCIWLKNQQYHTVNPTSMHFGPAGHRAWANLLYQHYNKNDTIRKRR
jgi:hypothetical protein